MPRGNGGVAVDPEQIGGGERQERAQPLAAADRGVTHRAIEIGARIVGEREQRVEARVDRRGDLGCSACARSVASARRAKGGCRPGCPRHRAGSPRSAPAPRRAARRSARAAGRRVRRGRSIRRASRRRSRAAPTIRSSSLSASSKDRSSIGVSAGVLHRRCYGAGAAGVVKAASCTPPTGSCRSGRHLRDQILAAELADHRLGQASADHDAVDPLVPAELRVEPAASASPVSDTPSCSADIGARMFAAVGIGQADDEASFTAG